MTSYANYEYWKDIDAGGVAVTRWMSGSDAERRPEPCDDELWTETDFGNHKCQCRQAAQSGRRHAWPIADSQKMMQYAVEGEELDPAELEDGTWVTPKTTQGGLDPLDLQHKYRTAASKPPEAMSEQASTPALDVQAARPPQLPRRRPMPRLPSEHYKIVIRPRHPINLSNIGLATLLEAIQNSAKVDPARAEEEDQIRIHPIKNTLTVSTPDRIRAEAYRSLEVLRSQRYNMSLPVATYVPAPDDSIRGVVYKAYTDETDHDLQAELMKKNPDIPIVNARRLGSSRHLVITFAGHKLPSTIRFRCFTLEVNPFRERPEACFNCRKLGHRTDVCPLPGPGIPKCRRCGGEHPPPPLGEQPTCTPQCVVCLGEHPTGSRSCKLRFTPVKPNTTKKTSMPTAPMRKEDQNHQAVDQDRGDISFYASNKQQQERLEQRPTKERGLEHRRSRANQQSGNYSARIQRQTRGQDQEPVNIPDSRQPFQIPFEIKDAATGQISRQ
ncbi:hypothetical protein HPB52_010882 [Rhipicephalus sanguineus]|uniref:CCHC-type domain-containing protein n=1 Tax=Rhipicephalus sanguineus TaxID=34632 RepID=A0A9D4SQ25_RHISA|nr:hypothetical protein HPB52_010882 [Rhipicephalus sanguineus]